MDLNKLLPNSNKSWLIENDIIYFNKMGKIPLVKVIDDELYISLDRRTMKPVIWLIKHFTKIGQNFLFCSRETIYEKHIHNEDLDDIIKNTLLCLQNEKFFDMVKREEFDYIEKIATFVSLYDCFTLFDQVHTHTNNRYFQRWYTDYFSSNRTIHHVKSREIREYFSVLNREVKLHIFLNC